MRKCWLVALGIWLSSLGWSQPRPYPDGDYWMRQEQLWLDWEVTCSRLEGHRPPNWPANEEEPGALLALDWIVADWPVVASFLRGQRLQAWPDSVGGCMWKDLDGRSWLRVACPDGFCFVRANVQSVRPLRASHLLQTFETPAESSTRSGSQSCCIR